MTIENLDIKNQNGVAIITINREKALNALNAQTISEIRHFFEVMAPTQSDLKGVVITGSGEKAFIAGADIKGFAYLNGEEGEKLARDGQEVFAMIEQFHKPVIAAVNGFALGGGLELAMSCHMRVASEKARFGQPEVNLGLIPGYGGTQRLVQLIGKGKAIELLMTADMIGAEEATRLGLSNHMVEHGKEVEKAIEIIEKIATKAPLAIGKIVDCVNAYFHKSTDGFSFEASKFGSCYETADFKEGTQAFIDRRPANFTGK